VERVRARKHGGVIAVGELHEADVALLLRVQRQRFALHSHRRQRIDDAHVRRRRGHAAWEFVRNQTQCSNEETQDTNEHNKRSKHSSTSSTSTSSSTTERKKIV
jgi:hypothetical protein